MEAKFYGKKGTLENVETVDMKEVVVGNVFSVNLYFAQNAQKIIIISESDALMTSKQSIGKNHILENAQYVAMIEVAVGHVGNAELNFARNAQKMDETLTLFLFLFSKHL